MVQQILKLAVIGFLVRMELKDLSGIQAAKAPVECLCLSSGMRRDIQLFRSHPSRSRDSFAEKQPAYPLPSHIL